MKITPPLPLSTGLVRFRPTSSKIWQRIMRRSLIDFAVESVEISPADACEHPHAICLPDEFEKVRQTDQYTTIASNFERLQGGPRTHRATRAFKLKDAFVFRQQVFLGRAFETYRGDSGRELMAMGALTRHDDGLLCANWLSETFFAHWLVDGVPLEMVALSQGRRPITLAKKPWLHEAGYREVLGLEPAPVECALFDTLWVVDDGPLNAGKVRRLKAMAGSLRRAARKGGAPCVFIRRGRSGAARHLINEEQVVEALSKRGFVILDPETSTVEEIITCLANARIAVCVEGSAQFHAILAMPPASVVVTIQPPYRFCALGKSYSDALDQRFAYTVADPRADGFFQPTDTLLATIDLADAAIHARR